MSEQLGNVEEMRGRISLGDGAQFWAYISPQNNTSQVVTQWKVQLSQGDWSGEITSNDPQQILKTPGLSGEFNVVVTGSGPNLPESRFEPQAGSNPNIGCNANCSSMVGIVANAEQNGANYWTTWDAICK